MKCSACGYVTHEPVVIVPHDFSDDLAYCSTTCAAKHGWPWMKSESPKKLCRADTQIVPALTNALNPERVTGDHAR